MSDRVPKFDSEGNETAPNAGLKLENPASFSSPLLERAQFKGSEEFQDYQCRNFWGRKFPGHPCSKNRNADPGFWASIEANDKVEDLTKSWMSRGEVKHSLDDIPVKGQTALPLWSGDYWPVKQGATSYRYAEGKKFSFYSSAVHSYRQPKAWQKLTKKKEPSEVSEVVALWSPSEKYDLMVGDNYFTLTNQQKRAGAEQKKFLKPVEAWMGICDGWAAASIMVAAPNKSVTLNGAYGMDLQFYPNDVRALVSLAWASGEAENNFIGGRCDVKKPELFPNGRAAQQDCFDTNPATFHLALGNLVGRKKLSFLMDATWDYEVWNQPLYSYEYTYFNPLDPESKSEDWKKVAIDYNDAFKAKDKFQTPLTRGERHGTTWDDAKVSKVVGVIATVTYVGEVDAAFGEEPEPDKLIRVTYTYDLEFESRGGKLTPTGGEWHENEHPDFLWLPKRGAIATLAYDKVALNFKGKGAPSEETTHVASQASEAGYPLCQVLQPLISQSSGKPYACPSRRE